MAKRKRKIPWIQTRYAKPYLQRRAVALIHMRAIAARSQVVIHQIWTSDLDPVAKKLTIVRTQLNTTRLITRLLADIKR